MLFALAFAFANAHKLYFTVFLKLLPYMVTAFEVFTLIGNENSSQYNLRFENAICFGREKRIF